MSVTASASDLADPGEGDRLCVISSDAHVGPTMEQLRPYCPEKLLPEFDSFFQRANELSKAPTAGNAQAADHRSQIEARHVRRPGHRGPRHVGLGLSAH